MKLDARIARLERQRPDFSGVTTKAAIRLEPDIEARVLAAKADGTFPQSLSTADLRALMCAARGEAIE